MSQKKGPQHYQSKYEDGLSDFSNFWYTWGKKTSEICIELNY